MPETKFFLRRALPNRKIWQKEMSRQRGKVEASLFIRRVDSKYLELFARSHTYRPRVLQKQHFEKNILPAIAAYQVLLEDGTLPGPALRTLDSLLATTIAGQKRFYKFLGKFPFFFSLLKLTLKPLIALQYPKGGWRIEFPDLGADVVALDGYGCFYLDVLTQYGLPELSPHFCNLDDLLYEGVSPYLGWKRTQTIGRGGKFCDFRYTRVKPNQG